MNQGKLGFVTGLGYAVCVGWFGFFPNGSSDPALADVFGPLARFVSSISHTGTGAYTITFSSDFGFAQTPEFGFDGAAVDISSWYAIQTIGRYDVKNRQISLVTHRAGTALDVAANANNVVIARLLAQDTTGK